MIRRPPRSPLFPYTTLSRSKSGARIAISSRARVTTMKKNSLRRPIRSAATGLLGMLMPVALTTTAQTPPALPPMPTNIESAAGPTVAHTQPAAYRTGLVPQVQAPAAGFNVANIESMAQQLTYGERVPGMAVAIVQGGRILSARGYGVTDVNNPLPVDAHTVFRLASLSKAFAGTMAGLLVNDGTLRWDSKVTDYVPGFRLNSPEATRSEEHTSELQSQSNLVCRLLLEKKKKKTSNNQKSQVK